MKKSLISFFVLSMHSSYCDSATKVNPKIYPPIADRNGRAQSPGADLNVDYLYWTAREDGLEYAYDGTSASAGVDAVPGRLYHPDPEWESGYRVGLAAYTGYDGWDLKGQYTWFKLSTQSHIQGTANLKPTWKINLFNPTTISFAANNWSLDFQVVDFLLRRKFFLSPKFNVQPCVGFKLASNKQTYMVTYVGSSGSGIMEINQHAKGIGISAGSSVNWYITKPVSVYCYLAASTLWFKTTPHRVDTIESTQYFTSTNIKETLSYAAPVLETFLGLSYESPFYKKKFQAVFQVGYEFQIWFDSNQFERTILDANGSLGNLNLQGLTVRGQLEF